jgi:predicted ATPase
LLAYPGARIYELSDSGIDQVDYEDCAAVQLTRSFLSGPERFLRRLFDD